jgi:hypothetical protein
MADREPDALVSLAARLGDRSLEWNELDFVGWKEFRRMVPTVVGLEIGRIERMLTNCDVGGDLYNALVRLRYGLRRFIDGIESTEQNSILLRTSYLEEALLGLSFLFEMTDDQDAETLRYIAHRLTYVHDRIKLIY